MQAHAAGWDTLRLFGVHPELDTIRGDYSGILVTLLVDIHEVTPEWIKLGRWTAYRHQPNKSQGEAVGEGGLGRENRSHLRRWLDANDRMPKGTQSLGVAPGATAAIDDPAGRGRL